MEKKTKATEEIATSKLGKQEVIEVAGTEYTLQFPGVRRAQQILDASKNLNGTFSNEVYNKALMDEVIVDPKTDWDYWDENAGYMEVLDRADTFLGKMLK